MTNYRGIEVGDDESTEGKTDGIDSTLCQCEQLGCGHDSNPCQKLATHPVKTPRGKFDMCVDCAINMWNYLRK